MGRGGECRIYRGASQPHQMIPRSYIYRAPYKYTTHRRHDSAEQFTWVGEWVGGGGGGGGGSKEGGGGHRIYRGASQPHQMILRPYIYRAPYKFITHQRHIKHSLLGLSCQQG